MLFQYLWLRPGTIYCDQPIVSETMRCVSDNLIKTIDNQRQNARGFYVRGKRSGREQEHRETQRERVCESLRVQERRITWVKDQDILTITDGNVI